MTVNGRPENNPADHQPTEQERDLLQRSIKKVRKGEEGFTGTSILTPRIEDWMLEEPEPDANKDQAGNEAYNQAQTGNNNQTKQDDKEETSRKDKGKAIMNQSNDNFGPWMVVQRQRRGKKESKEEGTKNGAGTSKTTEKKRDISRFSVLEIEEPQQGIKVNKDKSTIVFSKNTTTHIRQEITSRTDFKENNALGRYLGAMINNNRKGKEKFKTVIDRVHSKLKGWKSKCLSLAGRITLAQSAISPSVNFEMQNGRVPKGICEEIEKMQRGFIWGDIETQRKFHAIGWKTLCSPKHEGGLGLRKLSVMNDAFLMKIIWQLDKEPDSLWAEVIRHKYCNGNRQIIQPIARRMDSPLWKELVKVWPEYKRNTFCQIGDGLSTNFWRDPWVEDINSLLEFATKSISDTESAVWEWTNNKGEWDTNKLKEYLPEDIVAKITASPPPSLDQNEDTIGWKHTEDGDFSIGATYKGLEKWTKPQQNDWTKIWKWQGPQKAKTLIWRLLHDRLLTNQRKSHTFGGDDTCHSCRTQPEDTLHAFRNCPIASSTWMILIKPVAVQAFFRTNLKDWITLNLNNQLGTSPDTEWKDTFIITCWNLWNWRNRELHENSYQRPPNASREILKRCDSQAAISMINGQKDLSKHPNTLIRNINQWKKKPWEILFVNIYRESNRCADCLARKSLNLDPGFYFWDLPPREVISILADDEQGVSMPRLVCI
ncbi:hypothetical protein AHAS_Ahas14G0211400 [Arachis hypogaea]